MPIRIKSRSEDNGNGYEETGKNIKISRGPRQIRTLGIGRIRLNATAEKKLTAGIVPSERLSIGRPQLKAFVGRKQPQKSIRVKLISKRKSKRR